MYMCIYIYTYIIYDGMVHCSTNNHRFETRSNWGVYPSAFAHRSTRSPTPPGLGVIHQLPITKSVSIKKKKLNRSQHVTK